VEVVEVVLVRQLAIKLVDRVQVIKATQEAIVQLSDYLMPEVVAVAVLVLPQDQVTNTDHLVQVVMV